MKQAPVRQCIGCGARRDKKELARIVFQDGALTVDESGRLPGRGAYVCQEADCVRLAIRKNAFARALRTTGEGIDRQSIAALEARFKNREG